MELKKYLYRALLALRKSIVKTGVPLHGNERYAPFFIVGSGRSGNTLLRRVLNNHSALYIPPETYVLGRSIRQSLRYPQMSWADLTGLIYSNFEFHPEYATFELGSLGALSQNVSKIQNSERNLAYLLNAFYAHYRTEHGIASQRWGDKTPLNTFSMHELHAVFPDAKFIHIIRNPYDAIDSYVKAGIFDDYREATHRWRRSVEAAFEFGRRHPDAYIEITYDALVTDTLSVVESLCTFLEIDYEPQMLEEKPDEALGDVNMHAHHERVMKPIDTTSIGKGMKALKDHEKRLIAAVLKRSKNQRVKAFACEQGEPC